MRHPVLTAFAMMTFIGAGCFALACNNSSGPEIEPIQGVGSATPAEDPDSGVNKTISIPPKKKAAKDAGPPDTGAPVGVIPDAGKPSGDDDDDDDVLIADCPNDQAHMNSYLAVSLLGGGTTCTSHGTECNTNECCFVYPIPGLGQNYCLPQ